MALQVEQRGMMYEDVAASQTGQALGLNGRAGDFISHVIIVPETTGAGTVALLDGSTSRDIFVAGTLADLRSFTVPLCMTSGNSGGWKITTGANVHVVAVGIFS